MINILFAIFLILHGLVHMLYFGQSARVFELQPGMAWPDGSLAFSRLLGDSAARNLSSVLLVLAAIGFVIGGVGILTKQAWWRPTIVAVSLFSSVIYLLLWDGGFQHLDNKGGVGILINLAILAALLIFQWPRFDF
ncbi:MAG: hypothetical protein PVJ21_04405 [Anaerolineales bacterium]|jgi:hypothetical protein